MVIFYGPHALKTARMLRSQGPQGVSRIATSHQHENGVQHLDVRWCLFS